MKELKGVVIMFVIDWIITFLLYITGILVLVINLVQDLVRSPTAPVSSIYLDIILIVLISYILNWRFIKVSKKPFILSQVLFVVSLLALIIIVFRAMARGVLMNA